MKTFETETLTWRDVGLLALAFAATRALILAVGVLALAALPLEDDYAILHLRDAGPALDMWYRWDAAFYTTIATDGYTWQNQGQPAADMAFMPVYPLLVRAASGLTPDGCALSPYWSTCATIGGLAVSNAALFGALLCLFWLTAARHGRATAWRAAWLLLASPIGVFLSGVYTESLFLLLSLAVFIFLERGRFSLAVIAACAASLARPVGIALLWAAWLGRPDRLSARLDGRTAARLLLALAPGVVFGAYIVAMGLSVGDPLAYFSTYEQTWNRAAGTPIAAFTAYFSGERVSWYGAPLSWIDLLMTAFYGALAVALVIRGRGLGRADGLFALGGLAIPIASGTLVGMPRFGAVLFPFTIALARWADRPWRAILVYGVAVALAAFVAVRFVTGRWIA